MVNRDGSFSKGRTFFPFIERRCIIGLNSVRFRPRVTRAKIGAWLIKKKLKEWREEGGGGEGEQAMMRVCGIETSER